MNLDETKKLLVWVKQLKPAQPMDKMTPDAWQRVLAWSTYGDAETAVFAVAAWTNWIDPSEIAAEVRRIRRRRLDEARWWEWVPNVDPSDTEAWVAEQRALRDRIASGAAGAEHRAAYEAGELPPLTGVEPWRKPGEALVDRPVSKMLAAVRSVRDST